MIKVTLFDDGADPTTDANIIVFVDYCSHLNTCVKHFRTHGEYTRITHTNVKLCQYNRRGL